MTNNNRLMRDKRTVREVKRDREKKKGATENATETNVDDDDHVVSIGSRVGNDTVQNSEFESTSSDSDLNSEFNCSCNDEHSSLIDDMENFNGEVMDTISLFESAINAVRNKMYDTVDTNTCIKNIMEGMKREEEKITKLSMNMQSMKKAINEYLQSPDY